MESLANELIKDYRQTKWKEFLKRQVRNPQSSVTFWKRVNHLRACIRKRRIEAHILNNIKVTKNTEKAELFAESLESKFKQDMNSQFENDFYMKINEFNNKESIKNKFPLNQRVVKEFTYRPISMTPSIARLQIDGHFCEETHCCGGHGLASKSKETLYALEIKKILTLSIDSNKVKS